MISMTEILLRIVLFEFLALLILGSVLICRRFSEQPLERIRMLQLGLIAVAVALIFTSSSILPGRLYISLRKIEPIPAQQESLTEEPILAPEFIEKTETKIQPDFVPYPSARPETQLNFSSLQSPAFVSGDTEMKKTEPMISVAQKEPLTPPAIVPEQTQNEVQEMSSSFFETILLTILVCPVVVLLVLNFAAQMKLQIFFKRSKPVPEFVHNLFQVIRGTVKIRVELRMCDGVNTPMVFGLLRPILLLPASLCERSCKGDGELRACLAHEWSHLRRGDLLTWNIVRLFQYPLWMQPFYWMLRPRLLADQDYLADDEGSQILADRADYADVLLAMAQNRVSSPQNVLGMAGRKSQLLRRIEMLFNTERKLSQKSRKRKLVLPFIFLSALVLVGGTLRFGEKSDATEIPVAQITTDEKPTLQPLSITRKDGVFDVNGILYDNSDKPVPNAKIMLYKGDNTGPSEIVDEAAPIRTAADGSFRVSDKEMFCILAVSPDKRDFFLHMIPQDPDTATPQQLSPVAKLKRGGKLFGKVVDKNGNPIEAATVGYYSQYRLNNDTESDKDGYFEVYYPQGPEIITLFALKSKSGLDYKVFRPEFDDEAKAMDVPPIDFSQSQTLTLTGAKTVRVKAQWDDGTPAPGVTIAPWTLRNPNDPTKYSSGFYADPSINFAHLQYFTRKETDTNGVVEFDWMPDWAERISFFYADFPWWAANIPWKRLDIDSEKDASEKDICEKILLLHRPLTASGVVRFPDGKAAEGITVKCEGVNLNSDYKRYSAKTDTQGRYEITLDSEAAYVFGVMDNEWGAMPINPMIVNSRTKREELQNLDFTLRKTVRVHGNVVFGPNKEHLKGLQIGFSVRGKTDLDLPPEKQLTPLQGVERRRGDEEGCGGPDLHYWLWIGEAAIDENGNWSKQLGPGEYKIGISEGFIGMPGLSRPLLPDDANIIVPENADEEIVLNLEAKASGNGRLRGKVLLADGTPAVGVKLVGSYHKDGVANSITPDFDAQTDAEGNFDAPRTLEAVWLFAKNQDGSQQAVLSLDEKTETLNEPIRLQPLGGVTGRVVDFHGKPIPDVEIRYGVPVYGGIKDSDNWFDKRRDFPQRIRSLLRFGGIVKTDADGKFRIDGIIADSDCYVVYRAAKELQLGGNDGFQLAKVRLEHAGETRDLGNCRVNPASLDGWKKPEPGALAKITATFLDDKTGQPITNQRIDTAWAKVWHEETEPEKTTSSGLIFAEPEENPSFAGGELVTDDQGKVEFSLPEQAAVYEPNEIELRISCFRSFPGGSGPDVWNAAPYLLIHETFPGPFTEDRELTFRLTPYPIVTGKILDPQGKPIVGASLQLTTSRHRKPSDGTFAHKEFNTTTNADGVFQSMVAPDFDTGRLECNAPGFMPYTFDLKERSIDNADDWTFTVQKGTDVSGRLVDSDGNGVADLWVNFQRSTIDGKPIGGGTIHSMINDQLGRSVKTDAQGRFVAPSLAEEEYAVSVTTIPYCPNAENAKRFSRHDQLPILENLVFASPKVDLRPLAGETPAVQLEMIGYPTIALKFTLSDETGNESALTYSQFSFHGQFPDSKESWNVQTEPVPDRRDRRLAGGVAKVPKGIPVTLFSSLAGSYVRDGVRNFLREKQSWTLEYRLAPEEPWKSCTQSDVPEDSLYQRVSSPIGEIQDENQTLEIRIRK